MQYTHEKNFKLKKINQILHIRFTHLDNDMIIFLIILIINKGWNRTVTRNRIFLHIRVYTNSGNTIDKVRDMYDGNKEL